MGVRVWWCLVSVVLIPLPREVGTTQYGTLGSHSTLPGGGTSDLIEWMEKLMLR